MTDDRYTTAMELLTALRGATQRAERLATAEFMALDTEAQLVANQALLRMLSDGSQGQVGTDAQPTRTKRWSGKFDACQECRTTTNTHFGKGFCIKCARHRRYEANKVRKAQGSTPEPPR